MPCKGCIRRRGKITTTTRKLVNRFRSSLIRRKKGQTNGKGTRTSEKGSAGKDDRR